MGIKSRNVQYLQGDYTLRGNSFLQTVYKHARYKGRLDVSIEPFYILFAKYKWKYCDC